MDPPVWANLGKDTKNQIQKRFTTICLEETVEKILNATFMRRKKKLKNRIKKLKTFFLKCILAEVAFCLTFLSLLSTIALFCT